MLLRTNNIRKIFKSRFENNEICDNGTIEIINASFIADEETIFGELNTEYAECELEWYNSTSLNINDMHCKIPKIWKEIATKEGYINSNYGWCIYSLKNGTQYAYALKSLINDKNTRQAIMMYSRPSIHIDAVKDGMKDFICTFSTQLIIRNNKLHYIVYMRSNDAVFGYKNDRYWHNHVFNRVLEDLKEVYPDLEKGYIYWNVGSLHVYPRHFKLIEDYNG